MLLVELHATLKLYNFTVILAATYVASCVAIATDVRFDFRLLYIAV